MMLILLRQLAYGGDRQREGGPIFLPELWIMTLHVRHLVHKEKAGDTHSKNLISEESL